MAKVQFTGKKDDASAGGGSQFTAAPRGIYMMQIVEVSNGLKTGPSAKNPNVPMTKFTLEIAEGDYIGTRCWKSVPWILRGKLEKPAAGHGMAIHWLHACHMEFDGAFEFDEEDFLKPEHAMVQALLEVEDYEKVVGDRTFTNKINVVREVYTDAHPAPKELPPPPPPKPPRKAQGGPGPARQPVGAAAGGSSDADIDAQLGF